VTAIGRRLRPFAYQTTIDALLPPELRTPTHCDCPGDEWPPGGVKDDAP
jgi:hypothetical protein